MEKKIKFIVDTDILIKAYRGDKVKIKNLGLLKDVYSISIITAIELIAGAKNIKQLSSLNKALKAYSIVPVNEMISQQSLHLYKKYIIKHTIGLSRQQPSAITFRYTRITKRIMTL
ncbi:MAG TPA: hypothetical protein VHB48_11305 [Chitinophagaceae bacterium]|nr:hypothetical protein [Chitinophagaceae bacterium]